MTGVRSFSLSLVELGTKRGMSESTTCIFNQLFPVWIATDRKSSNIDLNKIGVHSSLN